MKLIALLALAITLACSRSYTPPKGEINVKIFGAVGDGVTDDTAAFARAREWAARNGGANFYVPRGTYKISIDATLPLLICGEGAAKSIIGVRP